MSRENRPKFSELTSMALSAWGLESRLTKACEEMAELTVELCKRVNGSPTTDEKIIDEIADVLVMAHQLRVIYGKSAVDARIRVKVARTFAAIKARSSRAWMW